MLMGCSLPTHGRDIMPDCIATTRPGLDNM